jgi:integrase
MLGKPYMLYPTLYYKHGKRRKKDMKLNVASDEEETKRFQAVKEHMGVHANRSVIDLLIGNEQDRIWRSRMRKVFLPKENDYVFSNRQRQTVQKNFDGQRKRIAARLGNPRLLRITFRTFRHWKATMEYHKTRDILHTMEFLGHRNIKNTLIYTQLVKFKESDDYHSATAKTAEEAKKLVEAGFDYICTTPEEVMIFRKRK